MAANLDIADRNVAAATRAGTAAPAWAGITEHKVSLLGYDINYVDEGQGDPIIFLHNGGGFWQIWANQVRHFAKTHRVLAVDWPGHGESSALLGPLTVDLLADTLTAFVDRLGLKDVVIVGNCIGASAAIRYQNLHPDKVRGLVLMNICPGSRMVRFPPARGLLFGLREGALKRGLRSVVKFIATRRIVARQFPGILFGGAMPKSDPLWVKYVGKLKEDGHNRTRINLLFSVNTFTLKDFIKPSDTVRNAVLIWGSKNRVASLKGQGYFHQDVCGIDDLAVVEGAGHLTMYEAPDQVDALIEGYLAKLPAAS